MNELATNVGSVPEWDLGDRMRKSLRVAGMTNQEMADYLGVARETISTWLSGRITPTKQTTMLWALRTGVPHEWLATGSTNGDGPKQPPRD